MTPPTTDADVCGGSSSSSSRSAGDGDNREINSTARTKGEKAREETCGERGEFGGKSATTKGRGRTTRAEREGLYDVEMEWGRNVERNARTVV